MGFRRFAVICALVCALVGVSSAAHATLLGISSGTFPDLTGGVIKVDYNGAGVFTAAGITSQYATSSTTSFNPTGTAPNRAYQINMNVDTAGNLISGTVTIKGTIASLGVGPNLLTGNITAFGFMNPPGGQVFDFLFDVTGGDLMSAYTTLKGGIILNAANGTGAIPFNGTFTTSFRNYDGQPTTIASGTADAFIVPEPASLGLIAISMMPLLRRRSR